MEMINLGCNDCHANMFAYEVLHDILTEIRETKAQKLKRISRTLEEIRKDLEKILEDEETD